MPYGKGLRVLAAIVCGLLAASCAGPTKMKEAQAHYKLGISHLNAEDIQRAYIEFQTARDIDPKNKEVHYALGHVHLKLMDYEKAEQSFKKAVKLDSDYSDARNYLCYVYNLTGRWNDAVKQCKKALENTMYLTPDKAFYNLGIAYLRLHSPDEAIKAFTNVIRRVPNLYPAYYGLALAHNEKRQYGEAAAAMKNAIEFDPRFKGDRVKAEEHFKGEMPLDELQKRDLAGYLEILKY